MQWFIVFQIITLIASVIGAAALVWIAWSLHKIRKNKKEIE